MSDIVTVEVDEQEILNVEIIVDENSAQAAQDAAAEAAALVFGEREVKSINSASYSFELADRKKFLVLGPDEPATVNLENDIFPAATVLEIANLCDHAVTFNIAGSYIGDLSGFALHSVMILKLLEPNVWMVTFRANGLSGSGLSTLQNVIQAGREYSESRGAALVELEIGKIPGGGYAFSRHKISAENGQSGSWRIDPAGGTFTAFVETLGIETSVTVGANSINASSVDDSHPHSNIAGNDSSNTETGEEGTYLFQMPEAERGVEAIYVRMRLPRKTVSGIYTLVTEDYVVAGLAEKLDAVDYNDRFKGVYLTEAALNVAHPTATAGDQAQVNEVGTTDVVNYSWDAEENIWVATGTSYGGPANTDALPEGASNLYFTAARVRAVVLTGLSLATGTPITAADTFLSALGKLQKQITDLLSTVSGHTTTIASNTVAVAKRQYRVTHAHYMANQAVWGNTAPTNLGGPAYSNTGATARTFDNTSDYTRTQRLGILTSAISGTVVVMRQLVLWFNRNSGFSYSHIVGFAENMNTAGIRFFSGFAAATGAQTNIEPDTLTDVIGICKLSSSNNLHIIHNDSSGVATTIDLGVNFPANTINTDRYRRTVESTPGGASVFITVERLGTAHTVTHELSTNLPALSQGLCFRSWITNNTNATIVGFDFISDAMDILIP